MSNQTFKNVSATGASKFWICKVRESTTDPETNKTKKVTRQKLVHAVSPTDVESVVYDVYQGAMFEWNIIAIVECPIDEILHVPLN